MPGLRISLLISLMVFGVLFGIVWARDLGRKYKQYGQDKGTIAPSVTHVAIGFVSNFLDTLGIGSFATTTSIYKLFRTIPDEQIPGTMLVGHMWPTVAQALIYITWVKVDPLSLVLLIGASIVGSWLGAGIVSRWPRRKVQIGMGLALLGASGLMLLKATGMLPSGGNATGLVGLPLAIGLLGNLILGAMMNIGIGAYGPSLILFGLLGMDLRAIFPIMMGSCAFIMPTSGIRFIGRGSYHARAALGLALGGVPGVILAAYVVKQLPVRYLLWLVVAVAMYSALALLLSARNETASKQP